MKSKKMIKARTGNRLSEESMYLNRPVTEKEWEEAIKDENAMNGLQAAADQGRHLQSHCCMIRSMLQYAFERKIPQECRKHVQTDLYWTTIPHPPRYSNPHEFTRMKMENLEMSEL